MRAYPNILNYVGALDDCLERDDNGEGIYFAGNRSVVFKVRRGDRVCAMKCYTLDDEGRRERYRQLKRALSEVPFGAFVGFDYLEDHIVCADQNGEIGCFDCVSMDWVEGHSLTSAISEAVYLNDREALRRLALDFLRLASELLRSPYVHCDVKFDNIMVDGHGSMFIVDLDPVRRRGEGRVVTEAGTPGFCHPRAHELRLADHCDDYPIAVAAATILAVCDDPSLWRSDKDRAVFDTESCVDGYCSQVVAQARRWEHQPHLLALLEALLSDKPAIYDIRRTLDRVLVCMTGCAADEAGCRCDVFDDHIDCDGVVAVSLAGQWGYLTDKGVDRFYAQALPFSEGLAARCVSDGCWEVIDRRLEVLFTVECSQMGSFFEGRAPVSTGGKWGYIDRGGRMVTQAEYDYCGAFCGGCAIVRKGMLYGVIDIDGRMVIPMSPQVLVRQEDGRVVALEGDDR
ncbi:MAG: WG repeat-containing protein [Rikenellaceae bacterium]|nr:WG repeat-containing protein [Rikenellaceae bacterium]